MIPHREAAPHVLEAADVLIRAGMLPRRAGEALAAKLIAAHKGGPAVSKLDDELAGHACRSIACAIGLGSLDHGADPKAVREHLAQMLDMSEHDGSDDHEAVLTKTLLAALAGKSRPVIAVMQSSGDEGGPDKREPDEATGWKPTPPGRPSKQDVVEFKKRHKR